MVKMIEVVGLLIETVESSAERAYPELLTAIFVEYLYVVIA